MNLYNEFHLVSKYRSHLMGLAILWIVWFHSDLFLPGLIGIKQVGYGGCDFFFFLSGLGCFCSLEKNSNISVFYMKRVKRIMPSYIPFIILWIGLQIYYGNIHNLTEVIQSILGNLLMTGWAISMPGQFNWYIQTQFFFYLLAPIIFDLLQDIKKKYWKYAIMLSLSLLIMITYFDRGVIKAVARFPLFIIGMMFAKLAKDKVIANKYTYILLIVSVSIGCILLAINYNFENILPSEQGWNYIPFILIVPGSCVVIAHILDTIQVAPVKWISIVGMASLSIYMIHIAVFDFIEFHYKLDSYVKAFSTIVLAIIAGLLYWKVILIFKKGKSV